MPDEIKNNEEVDLSHFYEQKSEARNEELTNIVQQAVTDETKRKRTTLMIMIGVIMVLVIVELVLILISTDIKQQPKHTAPPGYKWVTPKNGIPYYAPQK